MAYESATAVAWRAAELLPEPPAAHDSFGYLAWEELVLSTARRLQRLLDDTTLMTRPQAAALVLAPGTGRLDGTSLLALAARLAHEDGIHCADLLATAVTECGAGLANA
ncbi:hypothetical protein [Streptomyces shenzhenensis]|uniref:Uncharacterized protein n=1 Tax=Streptomyces shenzhenensis TaxID=943815 RepID=A0A3M0IC32_9ACTN|nr:hypothetical protein [Streptomyces shenzhenensis]RMB83799.1 hypothetical protein CTZ28_22030 [Streptomyces shenzhenensis]